jgi:hypothetical protein
MITLFKDTPLTQPVTRWVTLFCALACAPTLLAQDPLALPNKGRSLPDSPKASLEEPASPAPIAERLWESVPEGKDPNSLVADDLTDGVRVENIVEPTAEYHFASFGKPDPFAPPPSMRSSGLVEGFDEVGVSGPQRKEEILTHQLQAVNLDQVTIAGIWRDEDNTAHALLVTPSGKGFTVKENDPLSPGGVISRIDKDRILVKRYRLEEDGSQTYRETSLAFNSSKKKSSGLDGKIVFDPGKDPVFVGPEELLPASQPASLPASSNPAPPPPPAAPIPSQSKPASQEPISLPL